MRHKLFKFIISFIKQITVQHIEVILATVALIVATFLFFETQEQVRIAKEANKITHEANEITRNALRKSEINDSISTIFNIRSLAIAESSFVENQKQNRFYSELSRNDSRPYLIVENFTVSEFKVGEQIEIFVDIINTGRTPAYDVYYSFQYYVDSIYEITNDVVWRATSPVTIQPQSQIKIVARYDIEKPKINWFVYSNETSFDRKERFLIISVLITYVDIFKKEHKINQFGIYNPKTKSFMIDKEIDY